VTWPAAPPPRDLAPTTALYEWVILELTQALFADPPPGGQLPPEPDLAKRFGVSRTTLRRALDELESKGVIVRRQGLGTFFVGGEVMPSAPELVASREVFRINATLDAFRRFPGFHSECLTVEHVEAPADVAEALELRDDRGVVRVRRLDSIGTTPLALVEVNVPANIGQDITFERAERESIYSILDHAGYTAQRAKQAFWAEALPEEEAERLGMPPGRPSLAVERLTYTNTGLPLELARIHFRDSSVRLEIGVSRSQHDVRLTFLPEERP
jgi:GntR family transcriptional regulator